MTLDHVSEPVAYPTARQNPLDPPSPLRELRAANPLARLRYPDGQIGWLVTSHELAKSVLKDRRFGIEAPGGERQHPLIDIEESKNLAVLATADEFKRDRVASFLFMDPPDHTRLRMQFAGDFSVRSVEKVRPQIEHIVEGCLDAMEAAGPPIDLVKLFAAPVATRSNCALLGAPISYAEEIARFSAISRGLRDGTSSIEDVLAERARFRDHVMEIVRRKRSDPGDDVISHAALSGELTDDEILSVLSFLHRAGQDVAIRAIASSAFALLTHRSQFDALRTGAVQVEDVVEELLRYLSINQVAFTRRALTEIELAGITVHAGERVSVSLQAANRDPAQYDDPDTLRPERPARGHLAFGHGVHICIGQHLARLELRLSLEGLVGRFPTLELAVPASEVPYDFDEFLFGVRELPVAW